MKYRILTKHLCIVAPRAKMVGYDLLNIPTSVNEANAMTRDAIQNHISNNSWGTPDGFATIEDSSAIWRTAIESLNSVIRKAIKNSKIFGYDNSAFKIVFLAIESASRKWTIPIRDWNSAMNQFIILHEERLKDYV